MENCVSQEKKWDFPSNQQNSITLKEGAWKKMNFSSRPCQHNTNVMHMLLHYSNWTILQCYIIYFSTAICMLLNVHIIIIRLVYTLIRSLHSHTYYIHHIQTHTHTHTSSKCIGYCNTAVVFTCRTSKVFYVIYVIYLPSEVWFIRRSTVHTEIYVFWKISNCIILND